MNKYITIIVATSVFLLSSCKSAETIGDNKQEENGLYSTQEHYFPTSEWRMSAPEVQGMNSEKLIDAFEEIDQWHEGVNSVLITRNGYIVAEKYYDDYDKEISQWVYSATKGVTSALTGIAIDQGFIKLDDRVADIFSHKEIQHLDDKKSAITIEDLLNMRSGIAYDDLQDFQDIFNSSDPLQSILDLPMKEHPDTSYNYSSADSHLLSGIIQETAGMSTTEFANTYLFDPLQIDADFVEFNDLASGGNRLVISPRDMAKIGWLYLNEGQWEGEQIIPEDWVAASTTSSIDEYFTNNVRFGYQWYINEVKNQSIYYTHGGHGQYIISVPDLNMNVIFTSNHSAPRFDNLVPDVLEKIIQAAVSEEPLEDNQEGHQQLLDVLKKEEVEPIPAELPEKVGKINDIPFKFSSNDFGWSEVTLSFYDKNVAGMNIKFDDVTEEYTIGIDTIPRINKINNYVISNVGYWKDDYTFIQEEKYLNYLAEYTFIFTFDENYEQVSVTEISDGNERTIEGRK
ncbi:serine hydrolase domain-containing protein [Evansella clarkii]|uniref:serine hydrolase domain-containing protein n=1 Tax=Evansella clarkii TaxID=79879 RepID=UPI001117ADA8|nr:serine hydrolase [Evansella clarkii]